MYTYTVGVAQTVELPPAIGGDGTLTYTLGNLPTGLSFDGNTRALSGASAVVGQVTLSYGVTDADDGEDTENVILTVEADMSPSLPDGPLTYTYTVNVAKTVNLPVATGGNGLLRYTVGDNLPTGVAFDDATRALSWTPTAVDQEETLTYKVEDADGDEDTVAVRLRAEANLTPDLPNDLTYTYTVGILRTITLPVATGGNGELNYAVEGSRPPGLSFDENTRALSWMPPGVGGANLSYKVTDDDGSSDMVSLTVVAAANTEPDLPDEVTYTYTMGTLQTEELPAATGGNEPLTYTVEGDLPEGLEFVEATRTLSWTPTAVVPQVTLIYKVVDGDGETDMANLIITVGAANTAPSFGEASGGTIIYLAGDESRTRTLPVATGGNIGRIYTLEGTLPGNISFDGPTRALSGMASSQEINTYPFIYRVADTDTDTADSDTDTLQYTLSVEANTAPSFQDSSNIELTYTVDSEKTEELRSATGGNGDLTYTLEGGTLPQGLSFDGTRRELSGTATSATNGALTFTYKVADADYDTADTDAATLSVMLTVEEENTAPSFGGASGGQIIYLVGEPRTVDLPVAEGGNVALTYTLEGDTLPQGLTFSGTTLSGTATSVAGPFTLTYKVVDGDSDTSPNDEATLQYTLTVEANTVPSFSDGASINPITYTVGSPQTVELPEATGGNGALTYTVAGLPEGLSVAGGTRMLSGTATRATSGALPLTYKVADADADTADSDAATLSFMLTVVDVAAGTATRTDRSSRVNRAVLSRLGQALAANNVGLVTDRLEALAAGEDRDPGLQIAGGSTLAQVVKRSGIALHGRTLTLGHLLGGSSFVLPLNATGDGMFAGLGDFTIWGSGAYRNLSDKDSQLDWDGDMYSASLGVDARVRSNMLVGVVGSWSKGSFDYQDKAAAQVVTGEQKSQMTSVHPYVGWTSPAGRLNVWATVGYGWGEVELEESSAAKEKSDSTLRTVAVGIGGKLLSEEDLIAGGTTTLRLKGAASYTQFDVEGSGLLREVKVDVRRLRLGLEGSHEQELALGGRLRPSLEVALRQDGGEVDSRFGIELGAGLNYAAPLPGLTFRGRAHILVADKEDYEEWGGNMSVQFTPEQDRSGVTFRVTSGYGNVPAHLGERLGGRPTQEWSGDFQDALVRSGDRQVHLESELGYGLLTPMRQGLVTPYSGLLLSGDGVRRYRLGSRFELGELFEVRLEGERWEQRTGGVGHGVLLQGQLRF